MKYLPFLLLFFAFNATGQSFIDKEDALRQINSIMKNSPAPASFTMNDAGVVTKHDLEYTDVKYTFYIKDIQVVEYEHQLRIHFIKFVCIGGKQCFFCEKVDGAGVFHYLEVNSEEEGLLITLAFDFLMRI